MLACSVSYLYTNVVITKLKKIENDHKESFKNKFINYVAKKYNANVITMKTINEYCLKDNFLNSKIFMCIGEKHMDLDKMKTINRKLEYSYETLLKKSNSKFLEIDERIYLSPEWKHEYKQDENKEIMEKITLAEHYDLRISTCLAMIYSENQTLQTFVNNNQLLNNLNTKEREQLYWFLDKTISTNCVTKLKQAIVFGLIVSKNNFSLLIFLLFLNHNNNLLMKFLRNYNCIDF